MDRVTEALQRARSLPAMTPAPLPQAAAQRDARAHRAQRVSSLFQLDGGIAQLDGAKEVQPHAPAPHRLLAANVIAFDKSEPRTRAYDVLRNHLLGLVKADIPQVVAVTAPTPGCGVTVTCANLAFSIARARKQTIVVIDLKPKAKAGGLAEVLSLPRVKAAADSTIVDRVRRVRAGGAVVNMLTPPDNADIPAFVDMVKRDLRPDVLLLDTPPLLVGDEAAQILPVADLVLLVVAVGQSSVSELETCKSFLPAGAKLQVLMNKARPHGM
ncbi:hypothetical protein IGS74_13985 [Aureimonas sp. OT7]|uniref:hypothetical protein n=1 Tax=Aureimonas TaxID=414371 RepID=UPI0017818D8E|nr:MULTISPECIES: hypothetical protein [Aureimonas]QOG05692.1 hypothetical protein IGS74_13985 [Aureimonas sp. OT7]